MHHRTLAVLALLVLAAPACSDEPEVFVDPGFTMQTSAGKDARLEVSGDYVWWWNSIQDSAYEGWSTEYEQEAWRQIEAPARLELIMAPQLYIAARIHLDGHEALEYDHAALGFGWRAIYPPQDDVRAIDLQAAGLAASSDTVGAAQLADCELADSRVLAAFSRYPGTMDELIDTAIAGARERGLPEPTTWAQVVRDEVLYEMLFGEYGTLSLQQTTFAFVSLQLDPVCGDGLRLSFRTENDLAGPVARVPEL
jgi:hypothetical protein